MSDANHIEVLRGIFSRGAWSDDEISAYHAAILALTASASGGGKQMRPFAWYLRTGHGDSIHFGTEPPDCLLAHKWKPLYTAPQPARGGASGGEWVPTESGGYLMWNGWRLFRYDERGVHAAQPMPDGTMRVLCLYDDRHDNEFHDMLYALVSAILATTPASPDKCECWHGSHNGTHRADCPRSTASPAAVATTEGLRQGNWQHPDGGRIVGWVIEPGDVECMKADAFCLPREVAEALETLRAAHATPQPAAAQGWVMVPREEQDALLSVVKESTYGSDLGREGRAKVALQNYNDALAAAPQPQKIRMSDLPKVTDEGTDLPDYLNAAPQPQEDHPAQGERKCRFCGCKETPERAADPYTTDGTVEVCPQCNEGESYVTECRHLAEYVAGVLTCTRCGFKWTTPPAHGDGEGDACVIRLGPNDWNPYELLDIARLHVPTKDTGDALLLDRIHECLRQQRFTQTHEATRPTPEAQEVMDAARWRFWLSAIFSGQHNSMFDQLETSETPEQYTAAVDAAMAARGEG